MLKKSMFIARFFGLIVVSLISVGVALYASEDREDEIRVELIRTKARLAEISAVRCPHGTPFFGCGYVGCQYNPPYPLLKEAEPLYAERAGIHVKLRELEQRMKVIEKRETDENYLRSLAILKAEAELKALGVSLPPK